MTFLVRTYRVDTGAHVAHLDRWFNTVAAARGHALASNCKAHTPFIHTVRGVLSMIWRALLAFAAMFAAIAFVQWLDARDCQGNQRCIDALR